ncbi:MAG: hypothetical protein WCQ70_07675 [Lentimicrobiaceae bacterium]
MKRLKAVDYTHHNDNKVKTAQVNDSSDALFLFEYDINRHVTSDSSWGVTITSYDQLGNMVDRYDHLHTINNVSLHEHFTYDSGNQLKTMVKNDIPQCEMLYEG